VLRGADVAVFVAVFAEDAGEVLTSNLRKLARLVPTLYRFCISPVLFNFFLIPYLLCQVYVVHTCVADPVRFSWIRISICYTLILPTTFSGTFFLYLY